MAKRLFIFNDKQTRLLFFRSSVVTPYSPPLRGLSLAPRSLHQSTHFSLVPPFALLPIAHIAHLPPRPSSPMNVPLSLSLSPLFHPSHAPPAFARVRGHSGLSGLVSLVSLWSVARPWKKGGNSLAYTTCSHTTCSHTNTPIHTTYYSIRSPYNT